MDRPHFPVHHGPQDCLHTSCWLLQVRLQDGLGATGHGLGPVDINVQCSSLNSSGQGGVNMRDTKSEVLSRRSMIGLLGLAALSFAVPTVIAVSDAEAQAPPPPSGTTAPPATGTERRQERRIERTERRQARRTRRMERRLTRREGRRTRRAVRRGGREERREAR
jgi:hypothetical protein